MSPQFMSALKRGLVLGVISAAATFFAMLGPEVETVTLVKAVGSAFVAPLASRFGLEGYYDTRRARKGDVHPGDVGPKGQHSKPPQRGTGGQ